MGRRVVIAGLIAAFVLVLLDFNVAATVQVLAIGCVVPLLVSALHELGHAAVGAVVGFRIHQVSFGAGRTKARFRLGSVDIRLRSRLVGGWVANFPANGAWYRTRFVVMGLAGSGTPLFIAWLTRGLRSADSPAVANGWLYFTFVAGISAAASLTFHRGPSNSAWPSDGRQILDTLKLTRAEIEERLSRTDWSVNAFEFHDLLLDGAGIAPTGILTAALADNGIAAVQIEPDDATANIRAAVALLLDERHADALQYAEKALALALALEDAEPADVAYYRNAVAYTLAVLAEPGTLERATSLAHLAYADAELPVIAGTLGACLVQTGEPERGEELIQMSISGIVRSADWFHTSRFLLIGALERRDTVAARRAFGESEAAAAVDTGVETGLLLRLLPRLGAAEAVHRLGWLSANQPLDASESGADARIAALALDAWLSTSLEDETRWRLFDEQGGSRLSVSEANLEALRSAAARLQAIGSV